MLELWETFAYFFFVGVQIRSGNFRKLQPVLFIEGETSIVTISAATFALWIKINLLIEREMYDGNTI